MADNVVDNFQPHSIIEALLDMESKAEAALASIQREKDKLPARIGAETGHIKGLIAQEGAAAIRKMEEEYEISTETTIKTIQEEITKELTEFKEHFVTNKDKLKGHLFKRLTTWTIML